ncbi:LysR family transcriptional regulator [Magnetovibrio sp. PR-2]|uniref:LysR family transcriptional regulator n=1 Tax=Magnetovibrio sp. PR-2 TaxID=3120356 RepID=UPI002FCE55B4
MDWRSVQFDWNHVRAFLVTAEEGSLSAASRALNLTQPTIGRQVSALEGGLGLTLFERVGRSLVLTQSGLELLEHVRAMGEAATSVSLAASGQATTIEGHVTITATDAMAQYALPPAIGRLRQEAPAITIEIIASNAVQDLRRREADIAVRHVRPTQPDLIAKHIRDFPLSLYAHTDYLDLIGRPQPDGDLSHVDFIGFDGTDQLHVRLRELGLVGNGVTYPVLSENSTVVWQMVQQGLGVSVVADEIAEGMAGLERAFPSLDSTFVPLWLVTHRELKTSPRIRKVFDVLAETLKRPGFR